MVTPKSAVSQPAPTQQDFAAGSLSACSLQPTDGAGPNPTKRLPFQVHQKALTTPSSGIPEQPSYQAYLGYGRYSSRGQNEASAQDQNHDSEEYARQMFGADIIFETFADEGVPGAIKDRDGLNAALEYTRQFPSGVFIVESISRLGRSTGLCVRILDDLVDRGWRFIARKSGIDTDSPMWTAMAAMMAVCAEMENHQRAAMVRRGRRAAFGRGQAVGGVPIHYQLVPKDPNDPAGAKIVVKRNEYEEHIVEYFTRIADGQTPAEANRWANGLPGKLGRSDPWELDDGTRMIRNPRYKGCPEEGNTVRVLERSTGKRVTIPNKMPQEVLVAVDPAQQFVTPELWALANQVLDARATGVGPREPLYPRDGKSRRSGLWPSRALHCPWCGAKMHRNHGSGSRYVCSNAIGEAPRCGMYLSIETQDIHRKVGKAVMTALLDMSGAFECLCEEVRRIVASGTGPGQVEVEADRRHLAQLQRQLGKLLDIVEQRDADSVTLERIQQRRAQILALEKKLAAAQAVVPTLPLPTPEQIREKLQAIAGLNQLSDPDWLAWMGVVVPHFVVRPVRVPGSKKILMQALVDLDLVALLPAQWRAFAEARSADLTVRRDMHKVSRHFEIMLTELPQYLSLAQDVQAAVARGATAPELVQRYNVDYGVIKRALRVAVTPVGTPLTFEFVTSLPNRRRKRSPAPVCHAIDPPKTAPAGSAATGGPA